MCIDYATVYSRIIGLLIKIEPLKHKEMPHKLPVNNLAGNLELSLNKNLK